MLKTSYDATLKLWRGRDVTPIYNPKASIAHPLLRALENFGPKIAQISDDSGVQLTFEEIRMKTIRAAQNLQQRGYNTKQKFALIARNSHHVAPIVFASMCLGCPINTMDAAFGKIELIQMLRTTEPILIFCDIGAYDTTIECLHELKNDAKVFTFGGSKGASEPVESLFDATGKEREFMPVEVDGQNEIAVIICSSGTVGFSKCISWSHAAMLDITLKLLGMQSDDVLFAFSPLFWLCGMYTMLTGTLIGATRIITTEEFSATLQLRLIKQYQITFIVGPTTHMIAMLKSDRINASDLSSMKQFAVTGSSVPSSIREEMQSYLTNGELRMLYGMSELGLIGNYFHGIDSNAGETVGQLAHGVQVKIVDDQDNRCGINEDGEIWAKMPYEFLGYFGNQSLTDENYDNERFFRTGDLGFFNADGYLYIVDRKKDILFCNETFVSSAAIENHLMTMVGIQSVCVVGIPEIGNDLPAAIVVPSKSSSITEKDVAAFVTDHLSEYCELRGGVYFVESIPTTSSGKFQRRTVKEIAIELYKSASAQSNGAK